MFSGVKIACVGGFAGSRMTRYFLAFGDFFFAPRFVRAVVDVRFVTVLRALPVVSLFASRADAMETTDLWNSVGQWWAQVIILATTRTTDKCELR